MNLSVGEEFGEVYAVPGDDRASLFTFSDLIELVERTEEDVESSTVPDEGHAILIDPSVLELCQDERIDAVFLDFQRLSVHEILLDAGVNKM